MAKPRVASAFLDVIPTKVCYAARTMMNPILNIATQAARKASRAILRYVDEPDKIQASCKQENDYVTQADQQSEAIIIETIQKMYPDHAIICEESGALGNEKSEYTWIIDPIDGTANFMRGFMHFAISIAVMKKNQIEFGVIYDPIRQELFTATRGQGAYVNNRRMRVSPTKKLSDALIATGFPFCDKAKHIKPYLATFEKVFMHCRDIRRAGSAALDLAYVAAGRLDGYWESNLKIWDIAAGVLMIQEAGGKVTDFNNGSTFLENGNIVAGSLKMHEALIGYL